MFAKLIAIILATGVTACGLLVVRQHRIDLAHEMAAIHNRVNRNQQTIWQLRVLVHSRLELEDIAEMVARLEEETGVAMVPLILDDRCPPGIWIAEEADRLAQAGLRIEYSEDPDGSP